MSSSLFFFFNDTATTEIYTLSLHDALPISADALRRFVELPDSVCPCLPDRIVTAQLLESNRKRSEAAAVLERSEEHTSELQSLAYLVCRLLLEKKNTDHPVVDHEQVISR